LAVSLSHFYWDLHKIWCTLAVALLLQINGHRNQHLHSAAWQLIQWQHRYASTIRQSWELWIMVLCVCVHACVRVRACASVCVLLGNCVKLIKVHHGKLFKENWCSTANKKNE
jgi:hypothetical protein